MISTNIYFIFKKKNYYRFSLAKLLDINKVDGS